MTADDGKYGVLLWGALGQAKVLRPILEAAGHAVCAVYDRDPGLTPPFDDIPFMTGEPALKAWLADHGGEDWAFAVSIGGVFGSDRCAIAETLAAEGLRPLTAVHSRAWVADSARLHDGCQVMAMAAISEDAVLGRQCIVNTSASVDHECVLGDGVHAMPGATLAGCVTVGDFATIGSNATVLPRISIGAGAMIGAGAVVTHDVARDTLVAGVPARPMNSASWAETQYALSG